MAFEIRDVRESASIPLVFIFADTKQCTHQPQDLTLLFSCKTTRVIKISFVNLNVNRFPRCFFSCLMKPAQKRLKAQNSLLKALHLDKDLPVDAFNFC